jgi:hypothetical protein
VSGTGSTGGPGWAAGDLAIGRGRQRHAGTPGHRYHQAAERMSRP